MNSRSALFLLSFALAASASAAEVRRGVAGKNISTYKVESAALGQERPVNVLLPPDYDSSPRRYPVLYLLHGLGDDQSAWSYMTNLSGYAQRHELIVVMPDAGRSFYVNSAADPKARFEDFIIADLIPWVDSHFRSIPLRRARAVAGLSMGGYGAMFLGLKHQRRFGAIGAFSGALGMARGTGRLGDPKESESARRLRTELAALFGPPGSTERVARDPFALLEKVPSAEMPVIYIACGGQDFLIEENRAFVNLLSSKKIPYEYREVSPRIHSWDFWDDHIKVFLDLLDRVPGFGDSGE